MRWLIGGLPRTWPNVSKRGQGRPAELPIYTNTRGHASSLALCGVLQAVMPIWISRRY